MLLSCLNLVVEGCLVIEFDGGRELRLGPWQAATVPTGQVHRTRAEGRTVNLCFDPTRGRPGVRCAAR